MRQGLLISFLVVFVLGAVTEVVAQTPQSGAASNIGPGDTSSTIAPRLPTPPAGDDASVRQYLLDARQALVAGRTGTAQEALERAETRILDRSVPAWRSNEPSHRRLVREIADARQALGVNDITRAIQILDVALAAPPGRRYQPAPPPPRVEHIPPPPNVSYVWVPGHWIWEGGDYIWRRGHYTMAPE